MVPLAVACRLGVIDCLRAARIVGSNELGAHLVVRDGAKVHLDIVSSQTLEQRTPWADVAVHLVEKLDGEVRRCEIVRAVRRRAVAGIGFLFIIDIIKRLGGISGGSCRTRLANLRIWRRIDNGRKAPVPPAELHYARIGDILDRIAILRQRFEVVVEDAIWV